MSALGQKQTYAVQKGMSALPPKATSIAISGGHLTFDKVRDLKVIDSAVLVSPIKGWPMPFTETTRITLEVAEAVDLHTGIVLPPGSYPGIKAQAREDVLDSGITWSPIRYRIELTAEQLASMGATVQPNQSSEEIDVTEFVRLGQLKPI
jgi:hypothetical protein